MLSEARSSLIQRIIEWGVTVAYCFARLLNRSGYGLVTVFVSQCCSRFLHFSCRSRRGFPSASIQFSHFARPQQELLYFRASILRALVFPFASCIPYGSPCRMNPSGSISNAHLPLVSLRTIPHTFPVSPTASSSYPNPPPTKTCAKPLCMLHRSQAVQSLPISCFHLRSTRSRLAAFHSASLHCIPSGIHSTCYPHSRKPIIISIKISTDEVILNTNANYSSGFLSFSQRSAEGSFTLSYDNQIKNN